MPLKPSTPKASAGARRRGDDRAAVHQQREGERRDGAERPTSMSVRTRRVPPLAVGDAAPDDAGDAGADVEQREHDRGLGGAEAASSAAAAVKASTPPSAVT